MSITRINTNPEALFAGAQLRKLEFDMTRTMARLSTGLRVNTAADDPSGIGLINSFDAQYRGTVAAVGNAEDTLSMMNVVDTALGSVMELLQKGHEISIRAANDATLNTQQIIGLGTDWKNIRDEITSMQNAVVFNGKTLLDGTIDQNKAVVGPNGQTIVLSVAALDVTDTDIFGVDLTTIAISTAATTAIGQISTAIQSFSNFRANIGSIQREIENTVITLQSSSVNLAAALSRIQDADMAQEITTFTKQQILAQAGTAAMAQANIQPQLMLTLLGTI